MLVKLLHHSPLWLAAHGCRMSHDTHDKSDTVLTFPNPVSSCGDKDKELIERIGNKFKHKSVLEHLVYWFDIDGISRACLQELARHRTARLTVKSTRYTLKELKNNESLFADRNKYLIFTANDAINSWNLKQLLNLQAALKHNVSNDIAKYCIPEAFKTRLQWQCDGRNLQCFLELRTSKDALWEIRELAKNIFEALPEEHKYLYKDYVKDNA